MNTSALAKAESLEHVLYRLHELERRVSRLESPDESVDPYPAAANPADCGSIAVEDDLEHLICDGVPDGGVQWIGAHPQFCGRNHPVFSEGGVKGRKSRAGNTPQKRKACSPTVR